MASQPVALTADNVSTALGGDSAVFLGAGTFGETWRVHGVDVAGTSTTVAAKILKPEQFHTALAERETAWLRRMDAPGIVQLLDVLTVQVDAVDHTVLVCEFIAGGSVAENVAEAAPTEADVTAFAIALLRAVEHVHDADAVHRDIKPANIMLRDGRWDSPALIDFGLAKGPGDIAVTQYPAWRGSLPWMSPEQLRGDRARKASDLWACGVVLHELLSGGTHPFLDLDELRRVGVAPDEIAELVDGPPRALPETVSQPLQDVVGKLLSMKAWSRGSARRAAEMLENL
ncbi:serine/threonine-protein kinase [Curtobacterium poinsettiae]|uniref:serine/threonine-protein kinase n=1 Tax=Curtobacterium poinsettiae TaxID=159612 RepID=UPI002360D4BD|nr:serine/threonine-protein kinase [Curtobacterium flaccumfaciens]MDD1386821.1 serine/threonine-protein kinase [Curtobacterium flaccumfaciens pv. poinsettiae]